MLGTVRAPLLLVITANLMTIPEECPILIAKIRDPKPAAHQNIQLIVAEQAEPEPRVNIVTRSGASTSGTSQETGKNTSQEWVRRALSKATTLDLQQNKETFNEAKASNLHYQDRRYRHLGVYRSKYLVAISLSRHSRLPHREDVTRMNRQEVYKPSCTAA